MKIIIGILTLIFFTVVFSGCEENNKQSDIPPALSPGESMESETPDENKAEYRKISADEAHGMMETEEAFVLLDVRTDEEYREQRILSSVLMPDYEIGSRVESELPDKDVLILIYCRSGRRSANAANEIVNMGYTNVYDFGGIIDWPYETEND